MKKIRLLFFLILNINALIAAQLDQSEKEELHDWNQNTFIKATKRNPARTAILIIAPPKMSKNCSISNKWSLGKKVWEQYMNSHPNVDCYFLQSTHPSQEQKEQIWLEGNTIYVGDWWYEKYDTDRILHKTIIALEWLLPHYTHFIRTNLNTFINLKNANEYMETHHNSFFTAPVWQKVWYTLGYGIIFTADVAAHIVSEYRRLENLQEELISPEHSDDGAITALATGVWPYEKKHPFRCCPTLPYGVRQLMCNESLTTKRIAHYGILLTPPISLEKAIKYCEKAPHTLILYRTNGFILKELAQFYEYALQKNYPELPQIDLVSFVESL